MKLNVFLSVLSCKISCYLLRVVNRGGTALPGKIASFFSKDILCHVSKNVKTILVTGTNGKTTTCRIIENGLKLAGLNYFANKSGANLLNGVITSFCLSSFLNGRNKHDYAVIECDEAALNQVTEFIDPIVILVTNIFRDQLDRYGEITNTLNLIAKGINKSKKTVICINADCSLCTHLLELTSKKAFLFGIDEKIYDNLLKEPKDALYCIKCKHPYTYDYITYAHLGGFKCNNCGYMRNNPDVHVKRILSSNQSGSSIALMINNDIYETSVSLPGAHNIYNAVAAACVLNAIGVENINILNAISTFESGFGRMEKISINKIPLNIILVKNPAGFNQILNYLSLFDTDFILVIMLNDQSADGTDVSWIYDVAFEKLNDILKKIRHIYIGGTRAYDMALRLKYAYIDMNKVSIEQDDEKLVNEALKHNIPVYITPTYTAMFNLRNMLAKKYFLKEFYE
ncbi:MAG: MurT ligase domain-containing protein [Clostridia bacterium]|jgi:UDP-N-acetylmuramyl tripeptide synthase